MLVIDRLRTPPKPQPLAYKRLLAADRRQTPPKPQPRGGRTLAAVLGHSLRSFPAVLTSPAPSSRLPLWVPPRTAPHLTPPQPRRPPSALLRVADSLAGCHRRLCRRFSERPPVSRYSRPPGARRRATAPEIVRSLVS